MHTRSHRTDAHGRPGSRRRVTARVLLVPGVALAGIYLTSVLTDALGLTAAHPVGSPDDPPPSAEALAGAAAPGEAVHATGAAAALATLLVGAAVVFLRPGRPGHAGHLLASAGALLTVALIVGDPDNHGGQAGLVDPLLLALPVPIALAGLLAGQWVPPARGRGPSLPLLGFAAAAAGPAVWWGTGQALTQRNTFPPTADPHHNSHWHVMAVVAFTVVLLTVVAGLASDGWRLPAATAAADALVVGGASVWAPQSASALGPSWSVAAIAWGLGVVAVVVRYGRSGPRSGPGPAAAGRPPLDRTRHGPPPGDQPTTDDTERSSR